MPSNDKKTNCNDQEGAKLTSGDLKNILEVNKKSVEIYLEVERQNEDIIKDLTHMKKKIDDIDRNLFKLIVILGGLGLGTIFGILQLFLK